MSSLTWSIVRNEDLRPETSILLLKHGVAVRNRNELAYAMYARYGFQSRVLTFVDTREGVHERQSIAQGSLNSGEVPLLIEVPDC